MHEFTSPTVVISACLGFEPCRYNGEMFHDEFIAKLQTKVHFIPVCPETAIGLGIPRDVIRIIKGKDRLQLLQPKLNMDITDKMQHYARSFVDSIPEVDGFILKGKSPSCSIKDAKHYDSLDKGAYSTKGSGIFTKQLIADFPNHPFIDDGQLNDYKYREHFLIKLFMQSKLRNIHDSGKVENLQAFHQKNQLLLMCYSKLAYNQLHKILSSREYTSPKQQIESYIQTLIKATSKIARYTSNIKILTEAANNLSPNLGSSDKAYIEEIIEKYKKGYVPFSVPLYIIKTYAIQFHNDKLLEQSFFDPFPEELLELRDSGKARI